MYAKSRFYDRRGEGGKLAESEALGYAFGYNYFRKVDQIAVSKTVLPIYLNHL